MDKARVFFVLGGPGVGKGTACQNYVKTHANYNHLSAGSLLRDAAVRSDLIKKIMNEGTIVPAHTTVRLLRKRMVELGWSVICIQNKFLIDGFPRNMENFDVWNEFMPDVIVQGCVLFEADFSVMVQRILSRNEGRDDDNEITVNNRIQTFVNETQPVLDEFKKLDKLFIVNSNLSVDEVGRQFNSVLDKFS